MDIWADRTVDLVKSAQFEIQKMANRKRHEEMEKRIDYYYDGQLDYLDNILNDQFTNPDRLKLQKNSRNITKRIIDKISLLYKTEPTRILVNERGEPVNPKILKRVQDEIWNPAEINNVCGTAEKLMNLCRTVGVKVSYRDEHIKYDLKTPAELDVVQNEDDVRLAHAIIYRKPMRTQTVSGAEKYEYIVWTKDDHFKINTTEYESNDKAIVSMMRSVESIGDNKEMVNPYSPVIPFAWYRYDYNWRTFFGEGGDDLITAQENLDVKLTELNQLIKLQSFSIAVLIGYDQQTSEPIIIDPTKPFVIPIGREGADVKFVSPDAKITELWDFIVGSVNAIATDYDIAPGSFQLTGSARSGLELKLENVGLYERAWSKRSYAIAFENQLWRVTKVVHEENNGKLIPKDCKLILRFDDVQIPEDPVKEHNVWTWKFQYGVATPIDYLMFKNPNMTREDAEKELQTNLEFNKKLKEKFPSLKTLFEKQSKGGGAA